MDKTASQINPNEYEYHSLAANCLRNIGMITEAIAEAKIAYSMNSNDEQVKFEYFVALHEDAMKAMSYNRSSGKHLIINKRQLSGDQFGDIWNTKCIKSFIGCRIIKFIYCSSISYFDGDIRNYIY